MTKLQRQRQMKLPMNLGIDEYSNLLVKVGVIIHHYPKFRALLNLLNSLEI